METIKIELTKKEAEVIADALHEKIDMNNSVLRKSKLDVETREELTIETEIAENALGTFVRNGFG